MAGPRLQGVRKGCDRRRDLVRGEVDQGPAQYLLGSLTGRAAFVVRTVGQFAPLVGVRHHHHEILGERHRSDLQRPAVDCQRMPLHPRGDRQLVHDPAGHADELVLGDLPCQGEFGGAETGSGQFVVGHPDRQFQ